MTRVFFGIFALVTAAMAAGCQGGDSGGGGGDSDSDSDSDSDADTDIPAGLDGVDILLMVDDSASMSQEQEILATALYPLVNAFAAPTEAWPFPAVDELRIAVVTSNMGLSSDGVDNDDAWPGEVPPSCDGFGDDGAFQGIAPANVTIADDVIPCDQTDAQCPAGWTCESLDGDGIGTCDAGGSTSVSCPTLGADWAETSTGSPNGDFPALAACLAQQGTSGCGFDQQLASVKRALARDDQADFMVASHLLLVLVVSDEEDCSMEDGHGLFETEEVADQELGKVNIACGENPEFLFAPGDLHDAFLAAKGSGAVFFAAIVGVPYQGGGATACQGPGDGLDDCLDQDAMQLVPEELEGVWSYAPACSRSEDATEVTRGYPGRRYVELAHSGFGSRSYVYSICNPDWTAAFSDIAAAIDPLLAW